MDGWMDRMFYCRYIFRLVLRRQGETKKHVERDTQEKGGVSSYWGGGGGGRQWETRLHDVCFHGDGLCLPHRRCFNVHAC